MKHIITARVENKPGVVSRISGLFTRRGYNIESLVTGVTDDPDIYNFTVSVIGEEKDMTLLLHQLGRIVEVIEAHPADEKTSVTHELMYIKLYADAKSRPDIMKLADIMKIGIPAVGKKCILLEVTGNEARLDAARRAFEPFGRIEYVRSGAMTAEVE